MKRRLFLLIPLLAVMLVVLSPLVTASPFGSRAQAANSPSPDGSNHLQISLSGTSDPSKYSLQGSHVVNGSNQTVKFQYQSGPKAFLSDPLIGTGTGDQNCGGNTAVQSLNNIHVIATLSGKQVGNQNYNLCGLGTQLIFSESMRVSGQPLQTGSFCVTSQCKLTYTSDAGGVKPFGDTTTGTLKGGPNNQTYNIQVDSNGKVSGINNLLPGQYTFTANYTPPSPADGNYDHNVTQSVTITAGQDYNLVASGARAGTSSGSGAVTTPSDSTRSLGCDAQFSNPLTWILCPVISILNDVIDTVDGWITDELTVPSSSIFGSSSGTCNQTDPCNAYYLAWSSFRNIALGLMIIAGLVIVIAQALGAEILDAYAIRKTLPRLLIAAVGITLSWPLMQLLVNLSNDLGLGVRHLIYAPFSALGGNIHLSFGSSPLSDLGNFFFGTLGLVAAAGAAIALLGVIVSLVGTAALAVLIAIVVLILRQVAIILLILIAPIAIVAYILPNTQIVYKFWWESFSKALLMFPIIAAFIAAGRVFSAVTLSNNHSILGQIIGFLAYFAPYFLIPATFKLAGGALRQIGGFVNDRSRGGFDRLRQGRAKRMQDLGQRAAAGRLYRASNPLARTANRLARGTALAPRAGTNPLKWRSRYQTALGTQTGTKLQDYMQNDAAFKTVMGNDDYMQATMRSLGGGDTEEDWRRYLSEKKGYTGRTLEQGVGALRAAKRSASSDDVFHRASVIANASTRTGWKEEGWIGMADAINDAFGDDRDGAINAFAEMRTRANQVGRGDLGGGSFSDTAVILNQLNNERGSTPVEREAIGAEAMKANARSVWYKNGPGALAQYRADALRHVLPTVMEDLEAAHANGDDDTYVTTLAKLANLRDTINYATPEVGETLATTLFGQQIGNQVDQVPTGVVGPDGQPVTREEPRTLRSEMRRMSQDPRFLNHRRELYEQDQREQQLRGLGGAEGLGGPPMPPAS